MRQRFRIVSRKPWIVQNTIRSETYKMQKTGKSQKFSGFLVTIGL